MIALSVLGRTVDTVGTNDAAANFLCDLASLVYVDPEITENIQKVVYRFRKFWKIIFSPFLTWRIRDLEYIEVEYFMARKIKVC